MAILAVVLMHTSYFFPVGPNLARTLASNGQLGVQLFFVVSACTLFWSLHSRQSSDRKPITAFFIRRAARVAPLFWFAAFAYWAINPQELRGTDFAPRGIGLWHFVATLLFVHGWYPTTINSVVPGGWSIAAEAMFYLAVPWLFRTLRSPKSTGWCLVLSAVAVQVLTPFAGLVATRTFPTLKPALISSFIYWSFPSQIPVFLCGIMAYLGVRDGASVTCRTAQVPLLVFAFLVAFDLIPVHVVAGGVFGVIVCGLAGANATAVSNPPVAYLGKVSFSIYIWHFAVISAFAAGPLRSLCPTRGPGIVRLALTYGAVTAVSVAVAAISWHLIERPGIAVGRVLIRRRDGRSSLTTSSSRQPMHAAGR